jgi:hypothetical protein
MIAYLIGLSDLSLSYSRTRGGQEINEIALAWWQATVNVFLVLLVL